MKLKEHFQPAAVIVLEDHQVVTSTCVLQVGNPAFAERRSLKRSVYVPQVLGTDMKKHFDILFSFQVC